MIMAPHSLRSIIVASLCLASSASALNAQLVGTWTTKSAKVLTGPGFYNPINDSFIEPSLTGYSYSFTVDGWYEEAYYRTLANPTKPSCPKTVMQFQHGQVTENADGSLMLIPIAVDGRQLMSDPCLLDKGIYTRYNQTENFEKYQVYKDPYNGAMRLDLYQFNGSPMNPMYMAYNPALMLPTQTMNPTPNATPTAKVRRTLADDELNVPLNKDASHIKKVTDWKQSIDTNLIWWTGVGMTVFGGAAYLL